MQPSKNATKFSSSITNKASSKRALPLNWLSANMYAFKCVTSSSIAQHNSIGCSRLVEILRQPKAWFTTSLTHSLLIRNHLPSLMFFMPLLCADYLQVQTPNWYQGQSSPWQHISQVVPLPQTVPLPQQRSSPHFVNGTPDPHHQEYPLQH